MNECLKAAEWSGNSCVFEYAGESWIAQRLVADVIEERQSQNGVLMHAKFVVVGTKVSNTIMVYPFKGMGRSRFFTADTFEEIFNYNPLKD
jgi:hypothetical protein